VLIGAAAGLLLLVNGRIAGVSGIVNGLLHSSGRAVWRIAFLAGLLLSPWALHAYFLGVGVPAPSVDLAPYGWGVLVVVAGFLVGFGGRLANGCTSGHGVCGLARLSWRSLVATLLFMASGFLTVYLVRHVLGGGPW
jgi:hypothetical protein